MKKVIVLFLHVILILASGCGEPVKVRRSPETSLTGANHPVQESWTVKIVMTESGIRRGVIEAPHGAEYLVEGRSEHHLDGGIRAVFLDINGNPTTTITALKAVLYANKDIEALGNVIISSGSTVIRTEFIKRSGKDNMIRSNRLVTITRPGETIRGEGFESDQTLKKYRIFRGSAEAFTK